MEIVLGDWATFLYFGLIEGTDHTFFSLVIFGIRLGLLYLPASEKRVYPLRLLRRAGSDRSAADLRSSGTDRGTVGSSSREGLCERPCPDDACRDSGAN